MKLLNQYILIKVDEVPEKNESGLLLNPDQVRVPQTGTVVALPAKRKIDSAISDLEVGDRVHFLRYASLDGLEDDQRLCKPEHIIAVL